MQSAWIFRSPNPCLSSSKGVMSTRRIRRRIVLDPRCCSSSSSPPEETKGRKSMGGSSSDPVAKATVKIDSGKTERSGELVGSRKRKRRGGPLLWKRIFFASKKVRSIILLNIVTVIYASDIPVLKEVEQITDPALFAVVRFAITAIPLIPFVFRSRDDHQTRSAGMELGLWVSLGYVCQALGLLTSEAGQASFISAFTVIVVPLIDGMFGATIPTLTWTGALASLIGVGILESSGSPPCVGDILNLMGTVFFGIHMLRTEQIARNTKSENFLALIGYQVCVVAFSSVIWFTVKAIIGGEVHNFSLESGSWDWSMMRDWMMLFPWIPALYTGLFSTGLCLYAEMDAMRDVSATEAAIVYGLEPVWGATFAWFLLGERWGTTEWIGASLVLCGSLTVQILGTPLKESTEKGDAGSNLNLSDHSAKQNDLSLSTIVVKSRETSDLFRKQDKL